MSVHLLGLGTARPDRAIDREHSIRLAVRCMCPVLFLSDGYIANGAEPWQIPHLDSLPDLRPTFRTDPEGFQPYMRDPETLARPWAIPGTPGLEHRLGGLEKEHVSGAVSHDPDNHDHMRRLRAAKVERVAGGAGEVVAN